MSSRDDILQFGADHPGQLAAVSRWLRANGIQIPDHMTQPGSSVGDVVGVLQESFPGADPKHVGLVVRVLFGQAVDRDVLATALGELYLRHQLAELKVRLKVTDQHDGQHADPDPLTMAPYWAEIPEVEPPRGRSTYWNQDKAIDAIMAAFPALIEDPWVCNEIARVLWGSIQETTPRQFGELVETARRIQQHADDEGGLHMVVAPDAHGNEHALGPDEIAQLHGPTLLVDPEVTLDQEGFDDPQFEWIEDDEVPFAEEKPATITREMTNRPGWLVPALLGLVSVLVVLLGTWGLHESFEPAGAVSRVLSQGEPPGVASPGPKSQVQDEPISLAEVVEAAGSIIDPFDPKHLDASKLAQDATLIPAAEKPRSCTDFKLLHGSGGGPSPGGCYAVGCQEGHALFMQLQESVWHPCTQSDHLPKQGDCYLVTDNDRSTRSVAFVGGKWVDKTCR